MKRFIRTKDGIYEANSKIEPEKELQIRWIDDHCFETSWKTKPCEWKQADTIEELCDEFVVVYKESKKFKKPFTSFYSDIIGVLKEHDLSECEVYGAIWTDKGLIYVAKMNEKGELELL